MGLREILESSNKVIIPLSVVFPYDYGNIVEMESECDGTVAGALETYLDAEANDLYEKGIDMPVPMEIVIKNDKLILDDWTYTEEDGLKKMSVKDVVKGLKKLGLFCEDGYIEVG